jgi:2'-5' RNA ligase
MRLFVAIELDGPFRNRLVELQDSLRSAAPDISYTRAQNLHLTLKFIGEFEESKIPQLCDSLQNIPKPGNFSMALTGLDFLPERGPIRIVGAALDGGEKLLALQSQIETVCATQNIPRENRRHRPHITLARVWPLPRSQNRVGQAATVKSAQSGVKEFVLIESKLSNRSQTSLCITLLYKELCIINFSPIFSVKLLSAPQPIAILLPYKAQTLLWPWF